MPATRRSAGAPRGRTGPARGQSTISFANRVTKSVPKDAKSLATKVDVADRRKPAEAVKVEVKPNLDEQPEHEAGTQEEVEAEEEEEAEQVVLSKSEAELQAEKLSDAHIKRYWEAIEQERKAPRVHQQGLSVNDKVLRYFDVSSQYGPCIGIDRTKRWQRAERLGLGPPIEVLSVLLKEHKKTNEGVETAQMDHILNSIAVGS